MSEPNSAEQELTKQVIDEKRSVEYEIEEIKSEEDTQTVHKTAKINIKVRLKNPTFWLTFVPAFVAFGYSVLSALFDEIPAISKNEVINFFTAIITALTTLGVLVDPTSKGVCDCEHCRELEEPEK